MSFENEDKMSPDMDFGKSVVLKKSKLSYTREFLLSLSNLDICKKLPSGFDESLLSELEDASQSMPDRPRIPGSLPLQGIRRNEYGSSPPTRGDSSNYSRSIYGKWESRSSGRSDRDSDSQSDKDSDGRRYGHQSRRSWQSPEHDGLLGSGSFPRPSGYAGGISVPKVQTNEQNDQLGKSNEPYHPPRPYKALPYSRRDTDSYNDETFGSSEFNSEDRSEEERKRRASFETMRKEQQKTLQEKHKAGGASDLFEVLEEGKEEKSLLRNDEVEVPASTSISSNDLEKNSFASNAPVARPLVPPGFRKNNQEKSSGLKSLIRRPSSEVGKPETVEALMDIESNLVQNGNNDGSERRLTQEISLVVEQPSEKIQHVPLLKKGENVNSFSSLHVPVKKHSIEDHLARASSHLDSHETLNDPEIIELDAEILEEKTVGVSNRSYSTSILKQIFGSTLSMDSGSSTAEHHASKPDNTWSPDTVQSSKFAQWFSGEEAKAPDDILSRPNNIMSLLVSGSDKVRYQVSDAQAAEHFPNNYKTLEKPNKITPEMPSASNGISDQVCDYDKEEPSPTVLTCEDLENSILSEYSARTTNVQPLLNSRGSTSPNIDKPGINASGNASLHLLSLLQKGIEQTNTTPDYGIDINLGNKLLVSQENDTGTTFSEPKVEENRKNIPNSGNPLTLETLFGTAFMQELQSFEAPVSVQRGSNEAALVDDPDSHKSPFPFRDNYISSPTNDKIRVQRLSHDYQGLASDLKQQTNGKTENWIGFDDYQIVKHHTEAVPRHIGFEGVPEFGMIKDENLIPVGSPQIHRMSKFMHTGSSSSSVQLSSDAPIDITEKLAAAAVLSAVVKDERVMEVSERLPFSSGPYEQIELEILHRNLQVQQSSQFQPPQMSQMRPLYQHLDSHPSQLSSQMKFLSPELMFSHNSPPAHHQFPSNIVGPPFHQLNAARYDIPSHRPTLHQMHMLTDFHHGNQAAGLIQEMNQMQGFPIGPRPPTSLGVPMPGPNASNPPTDAFERLIIEMESRANSKTKQIQQQQQQPLAPGHSPGMYGHEVDLGFRYR
ncbi:hypothetical protein ACJIZ3_016077 [Penstemon smallii]|uniref:Uncharacterized protein n=1 Tax=Penstemon smallii TaxID=265156 RepID=A0ABD3RPD0_9LAMI